MLWRRECAEHRWSPSRLCGRPLTHDSDPAAPLLVLGAPGAGKTALIAASLRAARRGRDPRPTACSSSRRRPGGPSALRARLESSLAHGYEALHCLTPLGLARLLLETALEEVAGSDELTLATVGRGDRLAMLVERIDELPLTPPRLRREPPGARRRSRAPDRPPEGGADHCRGLRRAGPSRCPKPVPTGAAEREFAEIYRPTSRCSASGPATPATLVRDALAPRATPAGGRRAVRPRAGRRCP